LVSLMNWALWLYQASGIVTELGSNYTSQMDVHHTTLCKEDKRGSRFEEQVDLVWRASWFDGVCQNVSTFNNQNERVIEYGFMLYDHFPYFFHHEGFCEDDSSGLS
jgi:hypothetical protein